MSINRENFFREVRIGLWNGTLEQPQVDGIGFLLDSWEKDWASQGADWLAYELATVYHETDRAMMPVEEYGHGAGHSYGVPGTDGKAYYGRGYVQLTWESNYARMSPIVGEDLVARPELMLETEPAAKVLFWGMEHGVFTGKGLGSYISGDVVDFVNARRVINGLDRAGMIAGYARVFQRALRA